MTNARLAARLTQLCAELRIARVMRRLRANPIKYQRIKAAHLLLQRGKPCVVH
jgi:hypothetical protein